MRKTLYGLGALLIASGLSQALRAQVSAQPPPKTLARIQLAILQAEDRRAATAQDLATIRAGIRNPDPQTRLIAIRAIGRLERPALIADLVPLLMAPLPEIRAEAATAIGQAAQGWDPALHAAGGVTFESVIVAVGGRVKAERDPDVRGALCETVGRLPYAEPAQVDRAEQTLVEAAGRALATADRLGPAKGLEALERRQQKRHTPGPDAIVALRRLLEPASADGSGGARVRRLALETLIRTAMVDDPIVDRALGDPDPQVRRLAVRAAGRAALSEHAIEIGLTDRMAMVRIEALRSLGDRQSDALCPAAVSAAADPDVHVALAALDQLGACRTSKAAAALLERTATDLSEAGSSRGWHRAAHAIVSMARADPERAAAVLPQYTGSTIWQLRVRAARAAVLVGDRLTLDTLAEDPDDNVREAAVEGLAAVVGHDADSVYIAALGRSGYQVLRAAALALDGTGKAGAAVPALQQALTRLVAEGRDNSQDARTVIAETLTRLGARPVVQRRVAASRPGFTAEDLRRFAAPRARIVVRSVGTIELALITAQAPASVLRFVELAQAGYYNGLTFHRVEPNFVIQGGSPGANEYIGDGTFMRDELGQWPHVRGAVGVSTRGRDTGAAQFFIDLVDNPGFDHEYTVFAQVLNGIDLLDQVLEGDVIETVEILR